MKHLVCFHRERLYSVRDSSEQHYCSHFQWLRAKSDAFAMHFDYRWRSQMNVWLACFLPVNSMLICRSILMLDNARIHWNDDLIRMCDAVEVILARLSSYSSDFNLIETSFALLKAWIRRNEELARSYTTEYERFGQFLRDAVKERSRMRDPRNLFRRTEIQYPTVNLDA